MDPVDVPTAARAAVRAIMDAAPVPVLGLDAEGSVRYANRRIVESFGYPVGELIRRPIEELISGPAGPIPQALREDIRQRRERPMGGTLFGRRKDGSTFPLELSLTPVESDDERWLLLALTDVTRRVESEARADRLTRIWRTLAEANQAIIRAADPYDLCADVCRIAVETGGYLGAWTGTPDETGEVRPTAQAGALAEYVANARITIDPSDPRGQGPAARAIRESQASYVGDFSGAPDLAPWHGHGVRFGIRAIATLPMRIGLEGETRGMLAIYSAEPNVFDGETRTLLEALAANMSKAFGAFRDARELELAVAHRSELLERLAAAAERERAAIAADIHDDSVQVLAALDLRLGALKRRVAEVAPQLDDDVTRTQQTLADAVGRLRALLFDLEPVDADLPLPDALGDLAGQVFAGSGVRMSLSEGAGADLAPAERRQAVRVAKEAMTNVRKHARASSVAIGIVTSGRGVEITVSDDGAGVPAPAVVSPPGHRGLATMRDRAELAGGWLRIEPGTGGGTTVRFWFPDTRSA